MRGLGLGFGGCGGGGCWLSSCSGWLAIGRSCTGNVSGDCDVSCK